MQIPETPGSVENLDLLKRLRAYADGKASWSGDPDRPGPELMQACRRLYAQLIEVTTSIFAFLLDRVTAHEMEVFTLHDRVHGRKVAHLMWHIMAPDRRERLTPPEIAMLILAAHLHDLGMGLSPQERARRLRPDSDLWPKLEIDRSVKERIDGLRARMGNESLPEAARMTAQRELAQAEEVLLCQDTRERHAGEQRYKELLAMLQEFHRRDPAKVADIDAAMVFDGDSFRNKLIDVCVSHNEDAAVLIEPDRENPARRRFPETYPVGRCNVDLRLAAATLRLADILDFDRERTPPVLFHYLLPTALRPKDDVSTREWSKHLTISNWHIEPEAIIFRGRSSDHIIHHAVVLFAQTISEELQSTKTTFIALGKGDWPFILPTVVNVEIHEEGYRYVPYRFELDDERVYALLMGRAIYGNPLVAVRELLQNAIDACRLRDALTKLHEPHMSPDVHNRIVLRYETVLEGEPVRLVVRDTGAGMDAYVLERWFLKVGESYYNSPEFGRIRADLRRVGIDFAPVSEFGIGFLATFLLADQVRVVTAAAEPLHGDLRKRTLIIDGPTRLMRLHEETNEGAGRFKGTEVTLFLRGESQGEGVPSWEAVRSYIADVCQDLPYSITLQRVANSDLITEERIESRGARADIPLGAERMFLRIPVDDAEYGLDGEIALGNTFELRKREAAAGEQGTSVVEERTGSHSVLIRGGFKIGQVPGLPEFLGGVRAAYARVRMTWEARGDRRFWRPTLARDGVVEVSRLERRITQIWLSYLLDNAERLPFGQLLYVWVGKWQAEAWLERYSANQIYQVARQGWVAWLAGEEKLLPWENGEGGPLPLGLRGTLDWHLLELVLPRVCRLTMGNGAKYAVYPPGKNWREIFQGWRDFVSKPVSWGDFIEYSGSIAGLLTYQGPGSEFFNSRYEHRLAGFREEERRTLLRVLHKVAEARRHSLTARLVPEEARLLQRARETIGDLLIGDDVRDGRPISSFHVVGEGAS